MKPGVLMLVVGPSGVGKDTLLAGARLALDPEVFCFPQRVITRPESAGGEDHVAVTPDVFARQAAQGGFALSWSGHGLSYGVPRSIEDDLANGRHVVVNVSRAILDEARARFTCVGVVSVTAPHQALKSRLEDRGRESLDAVAGRLERATAIDVTGNDVITVVNDSSVEDGIARLVAALNMLAVR